MSSTAEHYLDGASEGPALTQLPSICGTCGRVDLQDIYSSLRVLQSLVANVMPARRPCDAHAGMVQPSPPPPPPPPSNVCSCRPLLESTRTRPISARGRSDYGNPSLGHSPQVCAQKEVTTLMMRHIPNRYSQSELIEEVTATGFGGTFDFYLPMDHSTRAIFGYCFINFTTPAVASLFTHVFSGKQLKMSTSRKIIEIVPAKLQGFDANLLHYSKKAVSSDSEEEFRPLFLVDGYRLSFSRVPLRQSREMGKQSSRQRSACPGKKIEEDTHTHLAQDIEAILRNACKLAGVDKTGGEGKMLEASYDPYVFDGGPGGLCWMEGPDQVLESSPIAAPISSPIPSPDFPILLDNHPRLTIGDM
ncbi:hypothetical protein FOZ61_005736 [Perkinsus olseni]|uniref:RRM domain-containing protein n=1 Tax=Perkinsus olseni TaxID=32597 RepID=A0A7J6LGI9_PEROL|nr:hypothetical protein FOZ61_005736 [Perkinsus olseni]